MCTLRFILPVCLLTAAGLSGLAAGSLTLADVPAATQKTISLQAGAATVADISRNEDAGETAFDVSCTNQAGDEQDFTVADDGTLLSVEVELAETPAAVQQAIRAQAPGWELESIDKNVTDPELAYEVEVSKDGVDRTFTLAADGVLLSRELQLTNAPAPVQAAIKEQLADGSLQSVCENIDTEGNTYDIEVKTRAGGKNSFSLAADGKLLSREVTLAEVPPGARKTIEARLGDGRILRIDKSLSEKRAGVLPFEVQGRKAGKPFNFSVGPRGKFLGMDD